MMFLGEAYVKEKQVTAGEYCSIKYVFKAGHSIDERGMIKIVFRYAGDFGRPQFNSPEKENYCSVMTSGECEIIPSWNDNGHKRPWRKTLFLGISRGYLDKDETITVIFGDRSGGSSGWRMQTFAESTFEFKTFVDPINTCLFKELPESPFVEIKPGKPVKGVCIAPSGICPGECFDYFFKLEDFWGNPAGKPSIFEHPGFPKCGHYFIEASDKRTGISARSNPILVEESTGLNHYWADFHGQSEETIGTNSIEDYFLFARDYAFLDIAGHQGNDFQITDSFWEKIKGVSEKFNKPGEFVVLPGYEWSGNTPLGGDRNVYFSSDGGINRSSRDLIPGERSVYPDAPTAEDLFNELKKRGGGSFVFAHAGGRYADMKMHDGDIEAGVEVHSAWGTFEWLLEEAFSRGYRIGICANSDDHKGRPGASYPGAGLFGSYGGLTCVLAPSLDRESIFEAVKARHFYATTGTRFVVKFHLEVNGREAGMMGDVVRCGADDSLIIKTRVTGTGPIESIEVKNGTKFIRTIKTYKPEEDLGRKIKIVWSGAETRGRARAVDWSGSLAVSGDSIVNFSPLNFLNPARRMVQTGGNRLEWESCTTGGLSGCIVELKEGNRGRLRMDTAQGNVEYDISSIGYDREECKFGGVGKKITAYRIPDVPAGHNIELDIPLDKIEPGENPVYLKINQFDGNSAWTSPVFILNAG